MLVKVDNEGAKLNPMIHQTHWKLLPFCTEIPKEKQSSYWEVFIYIHNIAHALNKMPKEKYMTMCTVWQRFNPTNPHLIKYSLGEMFLDSSVGRSWS